MPGFILHLTSAKMLLNQLPDHPHFPYMIASENDFMTGSLLPDATANKNRTHFRNLLYADKMMLWPDLKRFLSSYQNQLSNDLYLGYYFHLYIDKRFFKDYIPQIVSFYDKEGKITDIRNEICSVLIHKSNQCISLTDYLSEKYYYGDYTKMNRYLVEKYQLPTELYPHLPQNGIEGIHSEDMNGLLSMLKKFMDLSPCAVEELTVFELSPLLEFLGKATSDFLTGQELFR